MSDGARCHYCRKMPCVCDPDPQPLPDPRIAELEAALAELKGKS